MARASIGTPREKKTTTSGRHDEGDVPGIDLSDFSAVDPGHVIANRPLRRALTYFVLHRNLFLNQKYLAIIDYTLSSSQKRFFLLNLKTGAVESHVTAHGRGSDPQRTGWARRFSNQVDSHESSIGYFITGDVYFGKHGRSLRLEGLSETNSRAFEREVVIHAAPNYVNEGGDSIGRSLGCPAVDPGVVDHLISSLRGGALIYSYGASLPSD